MSMEGVMIVTQVALQKCLGSSPYYSGLMGLVVYTKKKVIFFNNKMLLSDMTQGQLPKRTFQNNTAGMVVYLMTWRVQSTHKNGS